MIKPLLGLVAIFLLIISSEYLCRKKKLRIEWTRKIIHVGVGVLVAFWPFFTTFRSVQYLAAAFLIVVIVSRKLHIFRSIHNVKRTTLGEVFYPIGIGISALLTTNKYVFAGAILHLSIADGLAAVVGISYGKRQQYRVGAMTKSYIGTTSFIAISFMITFWVLTHVPIHHALMLPLLILVPLLSAMVENIAPFGSDDICVPVAVIAVFELARLFT
ncbi:MAG: SEC59/DGK1/VTE5 family protein [Candidatus Saccharimonadales bacterium]